MLQFIMASSVLAIGIIVVILCFRSVMKDQSSLNVSTALKYNPEQLRENAQNPFSGDIPTIYVATDWCNELKGSAILSAYLCRWLERGVLRPAGFLDMNGHRHESRPAMVMDMEMNFQEPLEQRLYQLLLQMSHDGIIQQKEWAAWSKENHKAMWEWLNLAYRTGRAHLKSNGCLEMKNKREFKLTKFGKQRLLKMLEYKKYLNRFFRENNTERVDSNWKENMVYASIFGIEIPEYRDYVFITNLCEVAFDEVRKANKMADYTKDGTKKLFLGPPGLYY